MDKMRITIKLGTAEYRLLVTEDEQYMQKLASDVNEHIDRIKAVYATLSDYDCAMLAMLNMAQELSDLKTRYNELESRIETLRELPPAMPTRRPLEKKRTTAKSKATATEEEPVTVS